MNKKYLVVLIAFMALTTVFTSCEKNKTAVENLITNNMVNPLGLDEVPVFGWTIDSKAIGIKQTAYQIKIFEEDPDGVLVWDTGIIEDDKNANVELDYSKAENLKNTTDYTWTVTIWDNFGNEYKAKEPGKFSTGLAYELCTYNDIKHDNVKDATFGADAMYIGGPYVPFDADALTVYRMSYDFRIEEGSTDAGFVYAANEYRLSNAMYNDFLIEGENYINVVVDISMLVDGSGPAQVKIFRKGYGPQDYEQEDNTSLIKTYDLKNISKENMYEKHSMTLVCSGGNLTNCTLDGEAFMIATPSPNLGFQGGNFPQGAMAGGPGAPAGAPMGMGGGGSTALTLNPTGRTGDNCKYPRVNDIGFYTSGKAVFSNVCINHYNKPGSEIFGAKTGAKYEIFNGLKGVTVDNDQIIVENTLVYADPSYGSEPMVRTEFTLAENQAIKNAKLYVTSRGASQFFINGKRVDSGIVYHTDKNGNNYSRDYLTPGCLQFYGTMRYSTYDVADMLRNGKNAMGAITAPGWWGDEYVYQPAYFNWYGDTWGVMARLDVEYSDGTTETIVTNDKTWKSYADGPITYSSIYHGEYYDATKEAAIEGWSSPGYDDSEWMVAAYTPTADPNFDNPDYAGRVDYPAHVVEIIPATLVGTPSTKFGDNPERKTYIYDMGENMVGVPEIKFNSTLPKGAFVTLRYGETLVKGDYVYPLNAKEMDGMLYTENYRGARSLDRYITKGTKGGESFSPSFTFHGWQFLEVSINSDNLSDEEIAKIMAKAEIKGLQLSSVTEITTTFNSSNSLLDRFFLNVVRSHYDNNLYVGTDCPQRNERLPFLGDQQVYSETAVYMTDMTQFYSQYAALTRDYQPNSASRNFPGSLTGRGQYYSKEGVPFDTEATGTSIAWPMGALTLAWDVYANNEDLSIVRDQWDALKDWILQYINAGKKDPNFNYLFSGGGLSNHLQMSRSSNSGADQVCAFGRALQYMATLADALGNREDADYYWNLYLGLKDEFNRYMISEEDIPLAYNGQPTTAQSSYATPIYYNMVDYEMHPNFVKNYVERCKNEGTEIVNTINGVEKPLHEYSVTSGFTGTPCILGALAMHGEFYTAYKMLENEKYSSWLYPVTLGATSLWERWDTMIEEGPNSQTMNSFNHYAFGVSAAFMITNSLGIQRGENGKYNNVGYRNFILQPVSGGSLTFADGSYKSSFGTIKSSWKADIGTVSEKGVTDMTSYSATVPANTTATLYLPIGKTFNKEAVEKFENILGVEFIGFATRNNIEVAVFNLLSGGYDFEVKGGKLTAKLHKGYYSL
jgi:alpha-L-rhamnosidase